MQSKLISLTTLLIVLNFSVPAISAPVITWDILDDGNGGGSNPASFQPAGQNDTAGTFAASATSGGFFVEPHPIAQDGVNYASVSATEINSGINLIISESEYDSATSGVAPTISSLTGVVFPGIHGSSNIDYESSHALGGSGGGTGQGGAASRAWGVDSDSIISSSKNTVLLFDLTGGTDANLFGLDLLDLEGGNTALAYIALYNSMGLLIQSQSFNWPAPEYGDTSEIFFGVSDTNPLAYIAFYVGDDNGSGNGYSERIATADFYAAQVTPVPVPASFPLLASAIIFVFGVGKNRKIGYKQCT